MTNSEEEEEKGEGRRTETRKMRQPLFDGSIKLCMISFMAMKTSAY